MKSSYEFGKPTARTCRWCGSWRDRVNGMLFCRSCDRLPTKKG